MSLKLRNWPAASVLSLSSSSACLFFLSCREILHLHLCLRGLILFLTLHHSLLHAFLFHHHLLLLLFSLVFPLLMKATYRSCSILKLSTYIIGIERVLIWFIKFLTFSFYLKMFMLTIKIYFISEIWSEICFFFFFLASAWKIKWKLI